jgi:hypothetical protein
MVDNQHQKISGYRDLTQLEIAAMNDIKALETQVGALWRQINRGSTFEIDGRFEVDGRWMSIAKTHFEEGFSAFVRAVAQPEPRF